MTGQARAHAMRACALAAVAALAIFGICLGARLGGERSEPGPALRAPELRRPHAECSAAESGAARRAQEAERTALAKIARYPYAPHEGLPAVALLREAEHCHLRAGDARAAAAAAGRADAWFGKLRSDYRDRLVRYRTALLAHRPAQAQTEIAYLLALLADQRSQFTAELRRRQLELERTASRSRNHGRP